MDTNLILKQSTSNTNKDELNTLLYNYVESQSFFSDTFIKDLTLKCIKLGFTFDVIKQTFHRFLLAQYPKQGNFNFDFKNFIDEEKFIEQLILMSSQVEPSVSPMSVGNGFTMAQSMMSAYSNDFDDKDDLMNPDNYGDDYYHSEFLMPDYDSSSNKLNGNNFHSNPFQSRQLIQQQQQPVQSCLTVNTSSNNKLIQNQQLSQQLKIQQEQQEFMKQSMNRINDKSNLRPIIVDGEDVGKFGTKNLVFNRIKQVVDYFESKNHTVYVILMSMRRGQIMSSCGTPSLSSPQGSSQSDSLNNIQSSSNTSVSLTSDQLALKEMEAKNIMQYTPSKIMTNGKRINSNDDHYILRLAVQKQGIIVSNDNYKSITNSNSNLSEEEVKKFKEVIEERVLMYSFIGDVFMPAVDPLGKNGPSLDNFLRFEPIPNQQYNKRCPYKKKCTFGSKCKYLHPERGSQQENQYKTAFQSVLDQAAEQKVKLELILNNNDQDKLNQTTIKFVSGIEAASKKNESKLIIKPQKLTTSFADGIPQPKEMLTAMGPQNSMKSISLNQQKIPVKQITSTNTQHIQSQQQQQQHLVQQNWFSNSLFESLNKPNNLLSNDLLQQNLLVNDYKLFQTSDTSKSHSDNVIDPEDLSSLSLSDTKSTPSQIFNKFSLQFSAMQFTGGNLKTVGSAAADRVIEKINESQESNEMNLRERLSKYLNEEQVDTVLEKYPDMTDLNQLIFYARQPQPDF